MTDPAPRYLSPYLADALDRLTNDRCALMFRALRVVPEGLAQDLWIALLDEATLRRELVDQRFLDVVSEADDE
jgi:hypothetical protein